MKHQIDEIMDIVGPEQRRDENVTETTRRIVIERKVYLSMLLIVTFVLLITLAVISIM